MFLYVNKYNIKNNLNADILICILDVVVHQDYLKMLSKQIHNMLKSNFIIFYIKKPSEDPQDLYYDFCKVHFNEQDRQFIKSLNTHPKLILYGLLDNIVYNIDNTIHFTSYEIEFNIIDDIMDNNYTITTYKDLSTHFAVISKIKNLFA
jgi:hypothetical protein